MDFLYAEFLWNFIIDDFIWKSLFWNYQHSIFDHLCRQLLIIMYVVTLENFYAELTNFRENSQVGDKVAVRE